MGCFSLLFLWDLLLSRNFTFLYCKIYRFKLKNPTLIKNYKNSLPCFQFLYFFRSQPPHPVQEMRVVWAPAALLQARTLCKHRKIEFPESLPIRPTCRKNMDLKRGGTLQSENPV